MRNAWIAVLLSLPLAACNSNSGSHDSSAPQEPIIVHSEHTAGSCPDVTGTWQNDGGSLKVSMVKNGDGVFQFRRGGDTGEWWAVDGQDRVYASGTRVYAYCKHDSMYVEYVKPGQDALSFLAFSGNRRDKQIEGTVGDNAEFANADAFEYMVTQLPKHILTPVWTPRGKATSDDRGLLVTINARCSEASVHDRSECITKRLEDDLGGADVKFSSVSEKLRQDLDLLKTMRTDRDPVMAKAIAALEKPGKLPANSQAVTLGEFFAVQLDVIRD